MADSNFENLIENIEKRFGLVITIAIFFAVLMNTYFDVVGGKEKVDHSAFIFYPMVALYIAAYVFFELSKLLPPIKMALQILNGALLAGIACFALPIMFTIVAQGSVFIQNPWTYHIDVWTYSGSMMGLTTLPFVLFFYTPVMVLLGAIVKVFPGVMRPIKRKGA